MSAADIAAIFQGAIVTITLSAIGILIGLPIGLGLALIRWANIPVLGRIVALYVSMLRATPLVTLLLLLFFALPNIGVPMSPVSAAILGLVMSTSAFNCEVWRSALMNFPIPSGPMTTRKSVTNWKGSDFSQSSRFTRFRTSSGSVRE